MNAQERKVALQNIYTLSGYYNSIGGVLGIDQWGGLPDEGVAYRLEVNDFLNDQKRALYFTSEAEELAAYYQENPDGADAVETAQIRAFLKQRSFYQDVPKELFDELWDGATPLRLLGIAMTNITREDTAQFSLFPDEKKEKARKIDKAKDALNAKFGTATIVRGSSIQSKIDVGKKYKAQIELQQKKDD